MEEVFEVFIEGPAQSDSLRGADIPLPPPLLDVEVLREDTVQRRILESQQYLHALKDDGRHVCSLEDVREAKRFKKGVEVAALTHPLSRVTPRANAEEVARLLRPLMREEFNVLQQQLQREMQAMRRQLQREMQAMRRELQREMQAMRRQLQREIQAMRRQLQREMPAMRRKLQREMQAMRRQLQREMQRQVQLIQLQLSILEVNSGAIAFNSSANIPQAPIRPLMNDEGNAPAEFPATLRAFQELIRRGTQNLIRDYQIVVPRDEDAKKMLAAYLGLRAAT